MRTLIAFKKACVLAVLILSAVSLSGGEKQRENLNLKRGEKLFSSVCKASTTPVSFVYNGKSYQGLGGLHAVSRDITDTPEKRSAVMVYSLDDNTRIKVEAVLCKEFGEVEYTTWFENVGDEPTGVIEKIKSADIAFAGEAPTVRGCLGDHVNKYAPYEVNLLSDTLSFRTDGGRATHINFPYFDLVHGNGGTLIALGWAGTWQADFKALGKNGVHFAAQNCNDFRSVLMPGESIRTAMVVMLPYTGRNADDATNLWREWFLKYNTPRVDAANNYLAPFTTACFSSDTGLPNSDGSISERFYTWKRTLERIVYEKLDIDFRWFDAGWYFDPTGQTVPTNWWGTVGSWEVDSIKWPGNTLRESNEACHAAGMKVLTWFEPERVTNPEALAENYGYNPEWAISNGRGVYSNNLGDPECLKWTLGRIVKVLDENAIDLFREDNNSDPDSSWPLMDKKEEEQTGLPRKGITENKSIQGHYALWDSIISFCGNNGKCTYIDNCASGGGRNDIESLRRSIPFMRSDADRTTSALRLSMSSTFNKWIPFHGSSTKESKTELEPAERGGTPIYTTRASWLPVYNLSMSFTHDETLDYDNVRFTLGEWRSFSNLLLKDFYVLTPYHHWEDTSGWTIFAYNDRETKENIVLAFRQETCEQPNYTVKLPYAEKGVSYVVTNEDTKETREVSGEQLQAEGLTFNLDTPKSSALFSLAPR